MIAYYDLTENLYNTLMSDVDINTVIIGSLDKVDLGKQSMFPLAHILITSATINNGMVDFNVSISTIDIIDIMKDNPIEQDWKGQNNKQYILNTMFTVLENLEKNIDIGILHDIGWDVTGQPVAQPFEDEYKNILSGWSMDFTISIPNRIQNC